MSQSVDIGRDTVLATNGRDTFRVTAATGTAAKVTTRSYELHAGCAIKAAAGNTGTVFVGFRSTLTAGTAASTDGYPLAAGEEFPFAVADPSELYQVADAASQDIYILTM